MPTVTTLMICSAVCAVTTLAFMLAEVVRSSVAPVRVVSEAEDFAGQVPQLLL